MGPGRKMIIRLCRGVWCRRSDEGSGSVKREGGSMMHSWRLACALGVAVVSTLVVSASSVASGSHAHMTVIASGLDNPRDLAFGPGGRLFLAEAGHGGSRCIPGGEEGDFCVGFTSKIDVVKVARHRVRTVIDGLVSTAGKDGSAATGVDGIDVLGRSSIYG